MHDNTCKTNRYNCPLSIFVIPDNNLKTYIMAQAVVDDKTQFSYKWIFKYIKEATGMLSRVFIIDGDLVVNGVIMIQFLDSFHIYCIWHIY